MITNLAFPMPHNAFGLCLISHVQFRIEPKMWHIRRDANAAPYMCCNCVPTTKLIIIMLSNQQPQEQDKALFSAFLNINAVWQIVELTKPNTDTLPNTHTKYFPKPLCTAGSVRCFRSSFHTWFVLRIPTKCKFNIYFLLLLSLAFFLAPPVSFASLLVFSAFYALVFYNA